MCALRRLVIVLFVLGTCLPGTVALSAVREGATQNSLRESHWKLASGVLKVDEELKKVSQSNSEADRKHPGWDSR